MGLLREPEESESLGVGPWNGSQVILMQAWGGSLYLKIPLLGHSPCEAFDRDLNFPTSLAILE